MAQDAQIHDDTIAATEIAELAATALGFPELAPIIQALGEIAVFIEDVIGFFDLDGIDEREKTIITGRRLAREGERARSHALQVLGRAYIAAGAHDVILSHTGDLHRFFEPTNQHFAHLMSSTKVPYAKILDALARDVYRGQPAALVALMPQIMRGLAIGAKPAGETGEFRDTSAKLRDPELFREVSRTVTGGLGQMDGMTPTGSFFRAPSAQPSRSPKNASNRIPARQQGMRPDRETPAPVLRSQSDQRLPPPPLRAQDGEPHACEACNAGQQKLAAERADFEQQHAEESHQLQLTCSTCGLLRQFSDQEQACIGHAMQQCGGNANG